MKILRNLSRIIIGAVFIFSGFVKGVDPLGTAYRIEDYFIAYGTEWAIPMALFLSIFLCAFEFTLGISMFFNLRLRHIAWPLLMLMIYFTVLTFFDALNNPVPDCGCFGDVLKLTNWQTFYKNIVLIILAGLIFYSRKKYVSFFKPATDYKLIIVVLLVFVEFSLHQYRHLPMLDFLPWKVGTNMVAENKGQAKTYLTYRNKLTGETKEYLSPNYPWNDSAWISQWEFIDQRVDESGVKRAHSLVIFDMDGNDVTHSFINNSDYQFLVVAYDLEHTNRKGMKKVDELFKQVNAAGHSFIVLTGSLNEYIEKYRAELDPYLEFYNADDTELKMMIRANPGLILLKNGVVLGKWHYNDLPEFEELRIQETGDRSQKSEEQ